MGYELSFRCGNTILVFWGKKVRHGLTDMTADTQLAVATTSGYEMQAAAKASKNSNLRLASIPWCLLQFISVV